MGSPYTYIYEIDQDYYNNFISHIEIVKKNPTEENWRALFKILNFNSFEYGLSFLTEDKDFDIKNPDWSSHEFLVGLTSCLIENCKSYYFEPNLVLETWHRELRLIPRLGKIVLESKIKDKQNKLQLHRANLKDQIKQLRKRHSALSDRFSVACDLKIFEEYNAVKKSLYEKVNSGLKMEKLLRHSIKENFKEMIQLFADPELHGKDELLERFNTVFDNFEETANRFDDKLNASAILKKKLLRIHSVLKKIIEESNDLFDKTSIIRKNFDLIEEELGKQVTVPDLENDSGAHHRLDNINSSKLPDDATDNEKALFALRKLLLCHYWKRDLPFPMGNDSWADEGCISPEETELLVQSQDLWNEFLNAIENDTSGFKRDFLKLLEILKGLTTPYPYLYSIAPGT